MFKRLYIGFGLTIILLYAVFSLLGWELFSSSSRSAFRSPFLWLGGGGYRGGK